MYKGERRSEPRDVNEVLAEIMRDLEARKDKTENDRTREGDQERRE